MNVAILGNFRAGYTTENDLAWSLMRLGHEIIAMQEDDWSTDQVLERCEEARVDLLLYIHTHGWITPGSLTLDELWSRLADSGIITASFHLDIWRGLAREPDVGSHPFWRTQNVFSADGGSDDWYKEKGINHFWLPPGVVERDCYYAEPRDMYQHDVIFVGSRQYHPEWPYRPQLVDWLQNTYGNRFAHYGQDGRGVIRQDELNRLYRSAKVVVGDSYNPGLGHGYVHENYWSDRVPETLGRGGFLIHPEVPGIKEAYPDLVTYTYGDFDELQALIDYSVADYADRERLRLENHLQVKNNDTYTQHMQTLLNTVFGEEYEP